MRYSHLRAFHSVAVHGGFNAAARMLRVGQPAVSSQVKALEEGYGVILFDRGPRRTTLTKEGERLFEITSRLFSVQSEAESFLRTLKSRKASRLRLGSDAPYSVGQLAADFGHDNPNIRVTLAMGVAEDLEGELLDETLDIAILVRSAGSPDLQRIPYARHEIVLLVGANHPWTSRTSVSLLELEGQAMALRESSHSLTSQTFEQALQEAGVSPVPALRVNNRENLREAVAAGMGIGVGIAADAEADYRLNQIRISNADLSITDALVCKKVRASEPAISAFLSLAMRGAGPGEDALTGLDRPGCQSDDLLPQV